MTQEGGTRQRVLRGLAWTGGAEIATQVVRMLAAVTLARLLSPDDYGLAAMALVFASLVLVFSDLALGAAIVQRKNLSEDDTSTAFWMSIGAGIVFTLVGLALSGPVAGFYGQDAARPLCIALSLSFFITSLATTHEALLLRDMQFARLERRLMISTLAGAAAGVVVGLQTHDAWALIVQQLVQASVSTVLLWTSSPWRPGLRVSGASLRSLGSFSGYLVGHRLLYYVHRNADNILIGRYVGAAALGGYSLAYNVMLVPFGRIAGPVQRVLGPAFARMQDEPERLGTLWIRAVRLVACISVPALMGLVIVAPEFVHVVLGDQWAAAATLIQVLAVVGLLQSLQSLSTDVLQARGRTRTIFRFSILFSGAHIAGFVVGLHWGVVGVAAAYACTSLLVEPIFLVLAARSVGISPWRVLRAMRGVFEASLGMAACVAALRAGLLEAGVGPLTRLVLESVTGAVVYVALTAWRARDVWDDVAELGAGRLGRLRRRARPAAPRSDVAEQGAK